MVLITAKPRFPFEMTFIYVNSTNVDDASIEHHKYLHLKPVTLSPPPPPIDNVKATQTPFYIPLPGFSWLLDAPDVTSEIWNLSSESSWLFPSPFEKRAFTNRCTRLVFLVAAIAVVALSTTSVFSTEDKRMSTRELTMVEVFLLAS